MDVKIIRKDIFTVNQSERNKKGVQINPYKYTLQVKITNVQ